MAMDRKCTMMKDSYLHKYQDQFLTMCINIYWLLLVVILHVVLVLSQESLNNNNSSVIQQIDNEPPESDSSLLYSFSQFNIPVNQSQNFSNSSSSKTGSEIVNSVLTNPAQFLVLQFASTVIVKNIQVIIEMVD